MRVYRFVILLGVAVGLVTLVAHVAIATMPTNPKYFDYTLEPKSLPDKGGPVEMDLTFKLKPEFECDSVLVQVAAWKGLVYKGPEEFWASPAESGEYSTTLSVTVPPNDTSTLFVRLTCQSGIRCIQGFTKTFITTGDVMEVLDYVPTPRSMVKSTASRYLVRSGSWKDPYPIRSKLSKEILRTIDTVAIGLNDPDDFAFAESLLGPIPDSALITGTRGAYLLEVTLDNLFRMSERGIRYDRTPEYTELVFYQDTQQPAEVQSIKKSTPKLPPQSRTEKYWEEHGLSKEMLENRSRLTEDQLRTKHTVVIGLNDPEHFAFAENLLGSIPDTAMIPNAEGAYILEISLDYLLRLIKRGIIYNPSPEYRELILERNIQKPEEPLPNEESSLQEWPHVSRQVHVWA